MINALKAFVPKFLRARVRWFYWRFIERGPSRPAPPEEALRCRVGYNEFGAYCVPESSKHCYAAQQILAQRIHEEATLKFLAERIESGGGCVSAGAYFGDFLPKLSAACGESGKIWAFEPNPENFLCSKITILINQLENVVLINAGLGARPGRMSLETTGKTGRAAGGTSRIVQSNALDSNGLKSVEIVRIDDMISEDIMISVIQLDIEGFEKEALKGAMSTIERCRPVIVIEDLESSNLLEDSWFNQNFLGKGYRLTKQIDANLVFEFAS